MFILEEIEYALTQGAKLIDCCNGIGLSKRTFQRWRSAKSFLEDKRNGPKNNPNALTEPEKLEAFEIMTSERFADKSPYFIVATLADEGKFICSESSMYRILKKHSLLIHRGRSKASTYCKMDPLVASSPNQIWSWDISYLKGPKKRNYFFLYLFMDIFSRIIIGWEIHDSECSIKSSDLAEKLILKEKIKPGTLRIHSDNGTPMRSSPMISVLEELQVAKSFSRPRVSNDNPFSEALFKTLKYCPEYPSENFKNIEDAKIWVGNFVEWYNNVHKHSQIGYVTPSEKHNGLDVEILKKRKIIYEEAKNKNPKRFINGIKKFEPVIEVSLKGYRSK